MNDKLLTHLEGARWFGGKGRNAQLIGLSPLPWLRPPGDWPAVRSEVAEVGYPGSDDHEFYQLLISYRPADDQLESVLTSTVDPDHGELAGVDGTPDPAAHAALLETLLNTRPDAVEGPGISAHLVEAGPLHPGLPSRVFGGEQSNTSIMYAHVAMLKLFRRLEVGRNLDVETHDVLTRAGNTDIANFYGWLEGAWQGSEPSIAYGADLAMVVQQLTDARDGWEYALSQLRADHDFSDQARELGVALAHIHRTLRAHFPTDAVDGDQIADQMAYRLDQAAQAVPDLVTYQPGLLATFDSLRGRQLQVQRVHGDFHLGQALHTADGWKIIDFEGEPVKTLAERSRPDSSWRDVAGALRSFDYAAAHRRDEVGVQWAVACRENFLAGYGAELADPQTTAMLRGYEADKAIYEVVYEARNRPDWLGIPLAAIAGLAA
jgi:maltokinase